jgi:hypothetical protein
MPDAATILAEAEFPARAERPAAVQAVMRNLVNYFAAIGAAKGHVFELRDINHHVMMNVFAPEERALLDVALDGLIEDGALWRVSTTGCSLTDDGLAHVNRQRAAHQGSPAARGPAPTPDGQPSRDEAGAATKARA